MRGFREGEAVEIFGQGFEEGAPIGGAGHRKHEPWEFAREVGWGYGSGGSPGFTDSVKADVISQGWELRSGSLEEFRREVRPVNGGGVGHFR